MALVSNGTGGQADKIATGSIGQRPAGEAGMIRHCTTRKELVQEPGSTLEFYDPTTNMWQQLATFFAVDGVEILTVDDVKPQYQGVVPHAPVLLPLAHVQIPAGYSNFFCVGSCGVQLKTVCVDPANGENSCQMGVKQM